MYQLDTTVLYFFNLVNSLAHGRVLDAMATGHINGPLDINLDIEFFIETKCLLNSRPQPLESLKSINV